MATSRDMNILIFGDSGVGKSAICNVMSGSNDFLESTSVNSATRQVMQGVYSVEDLRIRLFDGPGLNDTEKTDKEILEIWKQGLGNVNTFTRVFFAISLRMTPQVIASLKTLLDVFFSPTVYPHVTIIRTRFEGFENLELVQKDTADTVQILANNNLPAFKVIHIDHPSESADPTHTARDASRIRLLTHLRTCTEVTSSISSGRPSILFAMHLIRRQY